MTWYEDMDTWTIFAIILVLVMMHYYPSYNATLVCFALIYFREGMIINKLNRLIKDKEKDK